MRRELRQEHFENERLESTVAERTKQLAQINAELESRVQHRTAELETANKELAAFSYSVSHDLRAPLRGIDGWGQALLEDYGSQLDVMGREYLNRVLTETRRMGHLIEDMLLLSRLSQDEMHLNPVDLTAIAEKITSALTDANPNRLIRFIIAPSLVVSGDARLLEIAMNNLFSNAVKFTSRQPSALIEFGKTQNKEEVEFFIRDNGAGFDMKYSSSLFGPFQRLHQESEFSGTGIGLAIVQRVIARHGGRVWADAHVDHGATFWFTLGAAAG
jgi:light-regulated signal transduction histidine kinase (bacteriophytochrome)